MPRYQNNIYHKDYPALLEMIENINEGNKLLYSSCSIDKKTRMPARLGKRHEQQGCWEGDQRIVQAVILDDCCSQIALEVTLLAAGFIVGDEGYSMKQIWNKTDAGIRSYYSEKFLNNKKISLRVFKITGTINQLIQTLSIIVSAVDLYKSLLSGQFKDEVVNKEQEIRGIKFVYKPPPITANPFSARTINFPGKPSEYGRKRLQRLIAQHQHQTPFYTPTEQQYNNNNNIFRQNQEAEKYYQSQSTSGDLLSSLANVLSISSSIQDNGNQGERSTNLTITQDHDQNTDQQQIPERWEMINYYNNYDHDHDNNYYGHTDHNNKYCQNFCCSSKSESCKNNFTVSTNNVGFVNDDQQCHNSLQEFEDVQYEECDDDTCFQDYKVEHHQQNQQHYDHQSFDNLQYYNKIHHPEITPPLTSFTQPSEQGCLQENPSLAEQYNEGGYTKRNESDSLERQSNSPLLNGSSLLQQYIEGYGSVKGYNSRATSPTCPPNTTTVPPQGSTLNPTPSSTTPDYTPSSIPLQQTHMTPLPPVTPAPPVHPPVCGFYGYPTPCLSSRVSSLPSDADLRGLMGGHYTPNPNPTPPPTPAPPPTPPPTPILRVCHSTPNPYGGWIYPYPPSPFVPTTAGVPNGMYMMPQRWVPQQSSLEGFYSWRPSIQHSTSYNREQNCDSVSSYQEQVTPETNNQK